MQKLIKPLLFLGLLAPFLWLVYSLVSGEAGANPVETVEKETGIWAMRWLWLTLAMTPLTRWVKSPLPVRSRRMIGLFALFYAVVHVLAWLVLDHQLAMLAVVEDLLKRPFVTVGMLSFVVLVVLGFTSGRKAKRRLGQRWFALHRWVYVAALAAAVHFLWLAKGDKPEPVIYLVVLMLLLLPRVWWTMGTASESSRPRSVAAKTASEKMPLSAPAVQR